MHNYSPISKIIIHKLFQEYKEIGRMSVRVNEQMKKAFGLNERFQRLAVNEQMKQAFPG